MGTAFLRLQFATSGIQTPASKVLNIIDDELV